MKTAEIIDTDLLQKENLNLQLLLQEKTQKILDQNNTIVSLEEQLAWLKKQIFGQRSEKVVSDTNHLQLTFQGIGPIEAPQKAQTIAEHKRSKPLRQKQEAITLPHDIPIKTTHMDLPEEEKICKDTGEALVKIGEEVSCKLAYQPGSYYVKKTIRPKYAIPGKPEAGIAIAALPDSIIPRCRADESLLSEILTKKFVDHLPLYRLAEGMGREGIGISHKIMSQWVLRCGLALQPLYNAMMIKILQSKNIYIDESPVKLQAPEQCTTAYLWVIVGGNSSNPPYRVYSFKENRRHEHVSTLLQNYSGVVHSDKYGAYQKLAEQKKIIWCPCYSHIRRKFFEAEGGDPVFRSWVLRKIRYLFMLERVAWSRSEEERLQIRHDKEAPIIDELIYEIKGKLIDGRILPKSKFREALGYFCSLIPYLKNYTHYPFTRMDNNVAERAIRPLVIGRKNWLFFGSVDGGKAGAIILSLVQTCRGLGINPREYLEDILRKLMGYNANKLEELLPDQWQAQKQALKASSP